MTATILKFPEKRPSLKEKDEAYFAAVESYQYFNSLYEEAQKSNRDNPNGILSGMHNLYGSHLKDTCDVFLSFLNNPCSETWMNARSYLVDGSTTAWQVWIKYDPDAPRSSPLEGEIEFPQPEEFIFYYNKHKEDRIKKLLDKRNEAQSVIDRYAQ